MKKIITALSLTFSVLGFAVTSYAADAYNIDLAHSSINFKVRHLFSKTNGNFKDFSGTLQIDGENLETLQVEATVQAASINTDNADRDKHLKSADFFDVESFPTITFKNTRVSEVAEGKFKLTGLLNLHGVEKEVVWDVAYHGAGQDPWGNFRNGLTATITIDRKDFGIVWNKALDNGGVVLGDEVEITVEIEGIKQAAAA